MFNESERKERIDDLMSNTLEAYISNGKQDFLTILVSEEKSMIEQAKKEAIKELAKKLKGGRKYCLIQSFEIDKLLKEYGIKEVIC